MGVNPGFLVLAFSIRTLQSSGVPARRVQARGFCVGMLPLVCSTPACRRAFSPLKISLWLSCLHCVGFQQFRGSGGAF